MAYIARGGFWLGLGQVLTTAATFGLSIAMANLLSPDSYGVYKYVLSINALLLIPTLSGIDASVVQAIARKAEGVLIPGMLTKMRWGFIGSAGALGVSLYYQLSGNSMLAVAFLITAIFVPFTESLDIYNALLQGRKLFRTFTIFNVLTQIISAASLIVTLFLTQNVLILIAVFFLSNTLLNGLFMILSIVYYPPNTEMDPGAISYGKRLSGLYIVSLIANELDKLLVFHYLGAATLALYTIAVAPTDQIKGILKNIQFLVLPKLAENSHRDIKSNLFHKTFILGGIVAAISVVYIIICPFVFGIVFPKYLSSVIYSQLISVGLAAAVCSSVLYSYIEVKRPAKELFQYHVWSNVINISLLFCGVYFFGLIGMVGARITSRFFVFGLTYVLADRM